MHNGGNSYLTTFDATIPYKHGNMTMTFCILKKWAAGWGTLCVGHRCSIWWSLFLAMKFTFLFLNLAKIYIFIPKRTEEGGRGVHQFWKYS